MVIGRLSSPMGTVSLRGHRTIILLSAVIIFTYRDIWPLATFNQEPADAHLGWIGIARVGLVWWAGIIVPFSLPGIYIPADPKNPTPPNLEQLSSLWSILTFSFVNPLIHAGLTHAHLPYEELPLLADDDQSGYLREQSFHLLDPTLRKSRRHIGWALIRFYGLMVAAAAAQALLHFVPSIAILYLLRYVEDEGAGATIRPWFWVLALFLRMVVESVICQRYFYLVTKIRVQLEGLLTQLVFEHSLRIRMKDSQSHSLSSPSTPAPEATAEAIATEDHNETPSATASVVDDALDIMPSEGGLESQPVAALEADAAATVVSEATETPTSPSSKKPKGAESDADDKNANLLGKINNLVSSDLNSILELLELPMTAVYAPLKITLSAVFLYQLLGWSFFVGFALMLFGLLVPGRLSRVMHRTQQERTKKTDARVQAINETVGLLRLVKMFGWETQMEGKIAKIRETELKFIRKMSLLGLVNTQFSWIFPLLTLLVTYFIFAQIMGQALSASVIFTSLSVMDSLRTSITNLMWSIPLMITGKVSLDRVNDFLQETEMLDGYRRATDDAVPIPSAPVDPSEDQTIGFHNAQFTWAAEESKSISPGALTPGSSPVRNGNRRTFTLRIPGKVSFEQGGLNIVVGPTGAGKTSVLLSLLGEMHFIPEEVGSWYNLPRSGGVAFCPQEAWIMNETIRDNILFGEPYQETRYKQVLKECALEQDLKLFSAGDKTEVGERGLTLSLARAVYSSAQIVLLDDVLAALDVHTARWVVEKCLNGTLLRQRTVILVTHNIPLVARFVRQTIGVSTSGHVSVRASDALAEALKPGTEDELDERFTEMPKDETSTSASGKLIADEEVVLGSVSYSALGMFFKAMGGSLYWVIYLGMASIVELLNIFQIWWLGRWGEEYETHIPQEVNVLYYLGIFALIVFVVTLTFALSQVVWIHGSMNASRSMHASLSRSILHTTLRFLDRTPVGRILQRFTQDISSVDGILASRINYVLQFTFTLVQKLLAILYFTPAFVLPAVTLGILGGVVGQIYIKAQMPVKREMSLARAPVLSHFGASIQGLTSIRAYDAQRRFINESLRRIDRYSRVARPFWNLNRALPFFIRYLVLFKKPNASAIGFQLNMSFALTEVFFYWVRLFNQVQVEGNSVERIEQYINIEQELEPSTGRQPPAAWPTSAQLRVEKLSARYSPDGPDVLRNISFNCSSGEKVGIVGRTGSGKSSLTLAILRLIPTQGDVLYDGISTKKLNLDALRLNITIIPQQPELMSGSIRQNLDPFEEHDDAELNDALRSSGLFNLQEDLPIEERINLDTMVGTSGGNFSLGQRQIIALARALVRRSKILILDEATASMDHKTDALIQTSLRTQFKDCTVLTIAHRLQTIMDSDKILVLDSGNLAEFDSPSELLAREGSIFREMVDGSGDGETLRALVGTHATH
ncbi:P-loop containing nucleoside triphosphate hydrolase protein [Clavulina sp. PMI_390]|nr:P-loop containing nucleoside triphosphate hydrolase protein [Clavulina sp. PMI_390]